MPHRMVVIQKTAVDTFYVSASTKTANHMSNATHYHLCDADPDRRYVWLPLAIDPTTIDAMGMSPRSPCFVCEAVEMMMGEPSSASDGAATETKVSIDTLSLDERLAALSKRRKAEAMANVSAGKWPSFTRDTGNHGCHAMGCSAKVPPPAWA